jgi:hypothetical protein
MLHRVASKPTAPFKCLDEMDCSLNGECNTATGKCKCDMGWFGDYCSILDLLPVDKAKMGLQVGGINATSSWGGTPVHGTDGKYHLFAEVMANKCGIEHWANNSYIAHATSTDLLGPYHIDRDLLKPFHHNVGAAMIHKNNSNDTWLIYSTGCDVWADTLANCSGATRNTYAHSSQRDHLHANRPLMPPGCSDLTPTPPWMPYKTLCLDGRIRCVTVYAFNV